MHAKKQTVGPRPGSFWWEGILYQGCFHAVFGSRHTTVICMSNQARAAHVWSGYKIITTGVDYPCTCSCVQRLLKPGTAGMSCRALAKVESFRLWDRHSREFRGLSCFSVTVETEWELGHVRSMCRWGSLISIRVLSENHVINQKTAVTTMDVQLRQTNFLNINLSSHLHALGRILYVLGTQ